MSSRPFILASASPRRLALLKDAGFVPEKVVPSHIDETPMIGEKPKEYARRLASQKGQSVAALYPEACVLAADTVVSCGRRILPQAQNGDDVVFCLRLLSGRRHRVYTSVSLILPGQNEIVKTVQTIVTFKQLSDEEIGAYVDTGEGIGKAGGYAIQGKAGLFVRFLSGSYSSVVGLPLYEVGLMLKQGGVVP